MAESRLGRTYRIIYDKLCGRHPNVRPWHFQWLDTYYLYRSLKRLLPTFGGRVLDAGCGSRPYQEWFGPVTEYVGLDVSAGRGVDLVVASNERWPLPNENFDVILSSQVLEHVEHPDITLKEMSRVLKRGGVAILTFPFLYNEHGTPDDYRRFTAYQAAKLFPDCEVSYLEKQGGIGSTIVILFLNWVDGSMNLYRPTRILKAVLLPGWLALSLVLNVLGLLIDRIDLTGAFYNNLLVVVKKPSGSTNEQL